MSKNSNFGGSSNMRTQVQNLWQAINSIETGGGGGTGNMTYAGTDGNIGKHYVQSVSDGKTCIDSKIRELGTEFEFGGSNLSLIDNITANSFIKNGGLDIQYLMADGSTLTASANSGNSNFYLYNSGTSESPTPSNGYITYNSSTQSEATIIYISHITRDNVDIEVYFKQITTITEVYVQDENNSGLFIQYSIAGTPTITIGAQIEIPVLVSLQGTTGFANGHNVFISFFTNGIEVDTRLSALENKTQHQTAPSGNTVFLSNVDLNSNELNNVSKMTTINGTLNIGYSNNDNYTSTDANIVCGNGNTINDNEQIIFGNYNSILSNQTVVIGASNSNINTGLGNVIGHGNSVIASIANVMGYNNIIGNTTSGYFTQCIGSNNICDGLYASCIGSNITNNTPNSLCLGDSAITTIYPNSLVCNLGTSAKPYKDIYYSGKLVNATTPILNITNSATIFYNGATQSSSNNSFISTSSSPAALALVGGLPTQVAQGTTTTKDKIFKTLFPESSVASFQDSGLLGSTNFLLNSQALYVGMGWNIKISFGIADTFNSNGLPSPAGMFVGLVSQNAINWSGSITPTFLLSCIGVGHGYLDSFISTYFKGSVSGTATATTWGTTTPDTTRWFHLSLTNLFNSNDIILTLTETISNVSITQTFTCGTGNTALATNIRLYPCIQRIIGNTASSGSGRIHLGQFTYNQLI